jgi:putative DNA primase/helicase
MRRSAMLRAALRYARQGWQVFPLNGKVPFPDTHGWHDATTNARQIKRWWKQWPDANIGGACSSEHGPLAIDLDEPKKNEYPARELLKKLKITPTRIVQSRPGRQHWYFEPNGTPVTRRPRVTYKGKKYALDVLGDGGYVVLPPSIHPETGKPYRWLNHRSLKPFPPALLRVLGKKQSVNGAAPPLPKVIDSGERNKLLTSLAGSMRRRGASRGAILAALRETNDERVSPPLPDGELKQIAKNMLSYKPVGYGEHLTDLGNARRFVLQHQKNVRAMPGRQRPWYVWDKTRWVPDTHGIAEQAAKQTVRLIRVEADATEDEDYREKLNKWASKSETAARIHAILDLASSEPELAMHDEQWDNAPDLLNLINGTLDLQTRQLHQHARKDYITKLAPVSYDPTADCPRWRKFLLDIMDNDVSKVAYLQEAVGYALTGFTKEQCFFICWGQGANGKGTFLHTIRRLLGDYAQQADFNSFVATATSGPRNDLAAMRGARFVVASEARSDRAFDTQVLKLATGEDPIRARFLYQEAFEYAPKFKLFLNANHRPTVPEQTEAFWRRVRLIPFTVTFGKRDRDDTLKDTLLDELSGILNWALDGTQAWLHEGMHEPKIVRNATTQYREENDPLYEFLLVRCKFHRHAWTPNTDLYQAYTDWWHTERGLSGFKPLSPVAFGRSLGERPELKAKKQQQVRGWQGVSLMRMKDAL